MNPNPKVLRARRALDKEITALDEQVNLARKQTKREGDHWRGDGESDLRGSAQQEATQVADLLPAEQQRAIEVLANRQHQLEQIRSWIQSDADILPSIRKIFEDDERKRARQALLINIALSTIFLLAGWGLSLIASPASFR